MKILQFQNILFFLHYSKISRPSKAAIVALLAWASCVLAFHWVEYRVVFVGEVQIAFDATRQVDGGPPFTDDEALQKTHEILEQETGHSGFRGFLLYRGRSGLEMRVLQKRVLHPAWAFGVWALDLLVLLAVVLRLGLGVIRRVGNSTNTVDAQ